MKEKNSVNRGEGTEGENSGYTWGGKQVTKMDGWMHS